MLYNQPPNDQLSLMSDWVFVAEAASIKPGHYETVDLDGTLAAVFNVNGEFLRDRGRVHHDGYGAHQRHTRSRATKLLPATRRPLCVRTGEALSPPATNPLPRFGEERRRKNLRPRHRWD